MLGASLGSIYNWCGEVFKNENLALPESVTGADGKQYPATRSVTMTEAASDDGTEEDEDRPLHPREWATEDDLVQAGRTALEGQHERDLGEWESRRNLTPEKFAYMIGRLYEERKREGFKGNQHADGFRQSDGKQTAEVIAQEYKIGRSQPNPCVPRQPEVASTIRRDGTRTIHACKS